MKLKVNDFFCGGGGFAYGALGAGFEIAKAWDIDPFAVKAYNANIGNHAEVSDIYQMSILDVPKANVWSFGFPCTDISIANMQGKNREKLNGKNSGTFYQVMRLLDEAIELGDKVPDYLLAENVEELRPLLGILEEEFKKRGYHMHYRLYNSKYWGVPQSRVRFMVVGTRSEKTFDFPEENQKIPKAADFLDDIEKVTENFYYSDAVVNEEFTAVDCKFMEGELNMVGKLEHKGWLDYMKRVYDVTVGVVPTFTTCKGGHRQAKIVDPRNGRVRRLTATEYGRMQGFPIDNGYNIVVSNSQMYNQFGNAVTTHLAQAMYEAIKKHYEEVVV